MRRLRERSEGGRRLLSRLLAALLPAALGALAIAHATEPARPRLVVVLSVDQLRADYLPRFEDLFLPARQEGKVGGFRYLMEEGAYHLDARHDHFPLYTAPGHAVLLTGALPHEHGIVDNWWYDRAWGRSRNCVEDPNHPQVGGSPGGRPVSPASLLVTTVGDELKMATGGKGKVWALALKDRAAVLMAGHLGDGALWFDSSSGEWVTSTFYAKGAGLPGWLARWNAGKRVDADFGRAWELSVPESALARLWTPGREHVDDGYRLGPEFPHVLTGGEEKPGKLFYGAFRASPFANEHVLETAKHLMEVERIGQDETPDLLAISLSSNDYVGHAFGPDSPEVLDMTVRTDRQLSGLFRYLEETVPGGLSRVTIVVTGDHGVAPVVSAATAAGLPAGFYEEEAAEEAAGKALDEAFGPDDWSHGIEEGSLYLNLETIGRKGIGRSTAEEVAAKALEDVEGIYAAYTRTRILEGRLPPTDLARRIARSFHPKISGDVVIVSAPGWLPGDHGRGTTHGSPYAYDTSVPLLLAGSGVRPGRHAGRVSTLDLAPTLAAILGVPRPSGSEGQILGHALARN